MGFGVIYLVKRLKTSVFSLFVDNLVNNYEPPRNF